MKFTFFSLCFAIYCLNCAFAADTCLTPEVEENLSTFSYKVIENRIYIKPGCVHIGADSIFIKFNNDLIPISNIAVDDEGIYVDAYELTSLLRCGTCKRLYDPDKQYTLCPHADRKKKEKRKNK